MTNSTTRKEARDLSSTRAIATSARPSAQRQAERAARVKTARGLMWQVLAVACALAIWEILVRSGALPSTAFSSLGDILAAGVKLFANGTALPAIGMTLAGWAIGLSLAALLAIPTGILVGRSRIAQQATIGVAEFLRPVPSIALLPVAVLLLGIEMETKVFLVVFSAFWPIWFQCMYGVRGLDPVVLDTGRSYQIPKLAFFFRVVIPYSTPYIATGMRIASAVALVLAVVAELIVGMDGIGAEAALAKTAGNMPAMYALIIMTGIIGWLLNIAFMTVERRLTSWHVSNRRQG
ncbi:ABC transporter permease [Microbacterium sp. NPDC096154]|uniref:ABC transporter permease n=1 Tax=Microbacterium sp. NPDC096154 TaxID=3155549 RepID=UPI00331F7693